MAILRTRDSFQDLCRTDKCAFHFVDCVCGIGCFWGLSPADFRAKKRRSSVAHRADFITGLGSLSFHLFANQASELLHMLPFVLLMFVYLSMAFSRLLDLSPGLTAFVSVGFLICTLAGLTMNCPMADAALQPAWSIRVWWRNLLSKWQCWLCANACLAGCPGLSTAQKRPQGGSLGDPGGGIVWGCADFSCNRSSVLSSDLFIHSFHRHPFYLASAEWRRAVPAAERSFTPSKCPAGSRNHSPWSQTHK